jgi:hypothetical protein
VEDFTIYRAERESGLSIGSKSQKSIAGTLNVQRLIQQGIPLSCGSKVRDEDIMLLVGYLDNNDY